MQDEKPYGHFGKRGRDIVSGFTGTIVARCTYWTGCTQLSLIPPMVKDKPNKPEGEWIDEQRVEILDDAPVELIGGSQSAKDAPAGPPTEKMPATE